MYRIDVYDTLSGQRLGYLRMIGNELSLVAPKGNDHKEKKPPYFVENETEGQKVFKKFVEERQGGRTLRDLSFRLV